MSRTCTVCDGEGKYVDYEDQRSFAMYFTRCEHCDGKGYLEKEATLVGETISYSLGKVPEPGPDIALQVAGLVQEARQKYNDTLPSHWKGKAQYGHRQVLDWYGYLELCDALEASLEREKENERLNRMLESRAITNRTQAKRCTQLETEVERLQDASRRLLELMTDYYFHAHDPELEAVNRLRRLVGMRDQLPKHLEAELQADEAEREGKLGHKRSSSEAQ